MNLFTSPPCWFWILSIAVSCYQGWRGFLFQHQLAKRQAEQDPKTPGAQTKAQLWFARSIADCQFYFLTTLLGFGSILLAYRIMNHVASLENVSAGGASTLVFLSLFGILGITGKLPDLIHQGKFPH